MLCQAYSDECVSKIKSILPIIFYIVVWFELTHFSFDDWEYLYSYYHNQIGDMDH